MKSKQVLAHPAPTTCSGTRTMGSPGQTLSISSLVRTARQRSRRSGAEHWIRSHVLTTGRANCRQVRQASLEAVRAAFAELLGAPAIGFSPRRRQGAQTTFPTPRASAAAHGHSRPGAARMRVLQMTPLSDTATFSGRRCNQRTTACRVMGSVAVGQRRSSAREPTSSRQARHSRRAGARQPAQPPLLSECSEEASLTRSGGSSRASTPFRPRKRQKRTRQPVAAGGCQRPAAGGGNRRDGGRRGAEPVLRSVMTGVFKQVADRLRSTDARKDQSPPPPSATSPAGPPSDASEGHRSYLGTGASMADDRRINKKRLSLTGKALAEASLFMDRDPEIKAWSQRAKRASDSRPGSSADSSFSLSSRSPASRTCSKSMAIARLRWRKPRFRWRKPRLGGDGADQAAKHR